MQKVTAMPAGGRPAAHFRNPAAVGSESRAQFEKASATGPMGNDGHSTMVVGRSHVATHTDDTTCSMAPAVKPLVLLAGERGFVSLLKYIIENNGFTCILTEDLAEAIALSEIERPDLIALDDMLPNGSALVARQKIFENLRTRHIPVLMLAGGSIRPEDLTMRLAAGTEYILKPFPPDAFIGRLHDLVRRSSSAVSANVLRFSDIIMDCEAHRVYRGQRCIRLGPVEYRVLQKLLEYPRKVLSREQILGTVRGHSDPGAARCIDVHMSRIRKALCEHGEPNFIRTVRGLGYSLDAAPDGPSAYIIRPNLIRVVK
jgi:two-component system phosphate regulon response regulator PhoB